MSHIPLQDHNNRSRLESASFVLRAQLWRCFTSVSIIGWTKK